MFNSLTIQYLGVAKFSQHVRVVSVTFIHDLQETEGSERKNQRKAEVNTLSLRCHVSVRCSGKVWGQVMFLMTFTRL